MKDEQTAELASLHFDLEPHGSQVKWLSSGRGLVGQSMAVDGRLLTSVRRLRFKLEEPKVSPVAFCRDRHQMARRRKQAMMP